MLISDRNIDGGKAFDWGRTSDDYAKYRDIYPEEFYRRMLDLGLCVKGQTVLDLGTGTGVLPRNLYPFGAKFTGVDISEQQIAQAKRLSQEQGMDINFVVSAAEEINFPDASFDLVTACQCFIYFDQKILLPKLHSVLKDGGHFCVIWVAWLPYEDEIANASEQLVLKYNPSWTGAGSQRLNMAAPAWSEPWFDLEHPLIYDLKISFTRESWHGRMKACRGIGASSLSEREIAQFEAEHIRLLSTYPETFEILHTVSLWKFRKKAKK